MTDQQKQAVANIRAAIKGKPAGAYAGVLAGDVVLVADLSTKPADALVMALRAGAAENKPEAEVHQITWQLSHLIGSVPADVQPV